MQIKYIASFLTLYEEHNISKASAMLCISQQGLSRQIRALEKELKTVLFVRSNQGVLPTPVCVGLHPLLRRVHDDYREAMALLEAAKPQGGKRLSVAFAQGLSNSGSAEFIFDYQRLHPELHIEIVEGTQTVCVQKLLDREIDLAFLVTPLDLSALTAVRLSEGYMYAAMHKTHPWAKSKAPLNFALLDGERIITGAPENALRGVFDYYCRLTGISPHIIVSSNFSLNYVNAMADNAGIATLTSTMALQIANPDIRVRRLIAPEPAYVYCCTPKRKKPRKEVLSLVGYVKEHFEGEALRRLEGCL